MSNNNMDQRVNIVIYMIDDNGEIDELYLATDYEIGLNRNQLLAWNEYIIKLTTNYDRPFITIPTRRKKGLNTTFWCLTEKATAFFHIPYSSIKYILVTCPEEI